MNFVEGSYATSQEAFLAVERLQAEGYSRKAIRLVSNTTTRNNFMDQSDINITTEDGYTQTTDHGTDDNRSMWEKIKEAFSTEDYEENDPIRSENDVLYNYQDDIANGNIVVVVDGEPDTESIVTNADVNIKNTVNDDEKTIKLQEEQLGVDTEKVQTGEVNVSKRVIEETKTIEVPVEHEEIVVKRHKVTDGTHSDGDMADEEIVIPVSEEQIHVTKKPVVTEEVTIGKEKVQETKKVSETVRKEDLDVDADGDVDIRDDNNL
ncbi:YsnF/AvaK domain-containing protein [Carnobacterium sp.]|uniref:YsnF/AvaK domain-containing protein n=1 Tax=Carnobacterium sp. TaxID=48221 RepID=UPI003C740063